MGHGGGESYFKPTDISHIQNCAVSMLIGCSSGRLQHHGIFDLQGTALNYELGSSPAVVSSLWDVTDKDIDRFAEHLITADGCLGLNVAESRKKCILRYLVGASVVIYGVPTKLCMEK